MKRLKKMQEEIPLGKFESLRRFISINIDTFNNRHCRHAE